MSPTLVTASYIGATILFVLSLGGLSNPETSRRGNLYGMIGMTIAVVATISGPQVTSGGYGWIAIAMAIGAVVRNRRDHAQPGRSCGGTGRICELHRPRGNFALPGRREDHPRSGDLP